MRLLYEVDPLRDARWIELVSRHERGSMFHSPQWVEALKRTYQFDPVVFTDAAPGERIDNGVLFCRVRSRMTGRRLVSLPFSDHCEPLVSDCKALEPLLGALANTQGRVERYIEVRPIRAPKLPASFTASDAFCLHSIDLRDDLDRIFSRLHPRHMRRTIRKAERLALTCEVGHSLELLREFYALHVLTRRRQGVPIQPFMWFRNLVNTLGDSASIYLARYQGRPAAAMMIAVHKRTFIYKYGCSDAALHRYGGTPFLFWRSIQDAKNRNLTEFDLGRSDLDNHGLLAFKDRLGAERTTLMYYRYRGRQPLTRGVPWRRMLGRAYAMAPSAVGTRLSSYLYGHFA